MAEEILLSTRVRLARNVRGYPFPQKISEEAAEELTKRILDAFEKREDHWIFYQVSKRTPIENMYDAEEHQISYQLMGNREIASFLKGQEEPNITAMLFEEDHLRVQYLHENMSLMEEYSVLQDLLADLETSLEFSFDEKLGYLTACPTNVGTGLRASFMLHMPAMAHFGMEGVSRSVERSGFVLRGMNGEGTEGTGNIFQISNERTLGLTEEDFIQRAQDLMDEMIQLEINKRKEFYLDHLIDLEDLAKRSYGILRNARILPYEEAMEHLSRVRLGIDLSVLKPKKEFKLYDQMVGLGKAHLQVERGAYLDQKSGNIYRANKARKLMKEVF